MTDPGFFRSLRSPGSSAKPAALYDRTIHASLERIWENVLDWEHLPHLHSQAFSGIRLLSSSDNGWRARVEVHGDREHTSEIEVVIDRPRLRYTTATLLGVGKGTEIVTQLLPRGERETDVRVEFFLPPVEPQWAASVGDAYRSLYEQLWDQDEAMMIRRELVCRSARDREPDDAAPGGVPPARRADADSERRCLGPKGELEARLPVEIEMGGRSVRVASANGELLVFDTQCPHLGGPLEQRRAPGCEVECPWHGYRFDLRSGRSSDGRGYRLGPQPLIEIEAGTGLVFLSTPA
ncbi:MAG: Rieske 2Fe-2S domain-containing protein [Deltaproteobacteria bacterium]|nr:Rieske 2Fe-2S domain-containing protein [Deltaproteobacteria bacterium]